MMDMSFALSVLFLLTNVLTPCVDSESTVPVVSTTYGNVQGMTKLYPDGPVLQYLGIPFAAPPIDALRFEKPAPHPGWNGTLMATTYGPSCLQYFYTNDEWLIPNKTKSEDCLQLNIFIPDSIDGVYPKSVMVWIHGGGFTAGQGTLYDGSYLALTGDVIVVTTNYRLGLLGFLSTEDDTAPGNYGLWDQNFALKWVHENIASFGGDPASVCIFGESAGGYSVGLHTGAPANKGYFQRAISESGALVSPRALASGARKVAERLGTILSCSFNTSRELVACLRTKSEWDILTFQNKATESPEEMSFTNRMGPVLDGDFITDTPDNWLTTANTPAYEMFKSVAVMAGTNNAEGGLMYFSLMGFQEKFNFNISVGIPRAALCDLVAPALARDYYNNNTAVSQAICDAYSIIGSPEEQSRSILDVYAHSQFVMPTIRTNVEHFRTGAPTYQYLFTHKPSYPWIQERPPWLVGANHAGEVPFVFGLHAMYKNSSQKPQEELALSRQMMIYWSNFAKTGNPNRPVSDVPSWPAFDIADRHYMDLKVTPQAGVTLLEDKYRFWTETVPNLTRSHASVTAGPTSSVSPMNSKTAHPDSSTTPMNSQTTRHSSDTTLMNSHTPRNGNVTPTNGKTVHHRSSTTPVNNGVTPDSGNKSSGAVTWAADLFLCCLLLFIVNMYTGEGRVALSQIKKKKKKKLCTI